MTNTSYIEDSGFHPLHFATGLFVLALGGLGSAIAILIVFFR
jgi:hypothetical protein